MPAPRRPRIALTLGDPNGIGPEIGVKLAARPGNRARADIVLFSDPAIVAAGERIAEVALGLDGAGAPRLEALDLVAAGDIEPGKATRAGGHAALRALDAALAAVAGGAVDAIVFAPLNKHAMHLAGLAEEDELRYMQRFFAVDGFVSEFNITGAMWTSRVTSHVPLREVADAITTDGVVDAVRILHRYQVAAGTASPRIAVTALNPHAGDGGSLGREEIDVIGPAIARARGEGIDAHGPLPSDTVFVAARDGHYDAVVTMYHDQGQIAMKLLGFERGVTLHGGLPAPIATCASGTAFDIVGRNVANVEGLQSAFDLVTTIAARTPAPAG
jgi:4-hydroxythreonine-4-phosphate dehydrogenase